MSAPQRTWPTRDGRWGIRQCYRGQPTGGGTINLGWRTRTEAEQANPPCGEHTFEAFPRWDAPAARPGIETFVGFSATEAVAS